MLKVKGTSLGSVYYRKDRKRWAASIFETDPITQKKKHIEKTFLTEEEAHMHLRTLLYRKENPIYIQYNGIPLKELMISILEKKMEAHVISEAQYERVKRTHNVIFKGKIVEKKIEDIKSEELQDYINTFMNYSKSSIDKIYGQFKYAFKYALDKGYIYRNPMVHVLKPKSTIQTKLVRAMTLDEETIFLSYLQKKSLDKCPYKNEFLMQLFLGLRVGECLALNHSDIDLVNRKIYIHKTLSRSVNGKVSMSTSPKSQAGNRYLPIPDSLYPYILEQIQYSDRQENNPEKLLFKPKINRYTTLDNVNQALSKILDELNIEHMTSHSLRHTYATRAIEAGVTPVVLQRLLGHADVATTLNTYTNVFDKYKASELDKIINYYIQENLISP